MERGKSLYLTLDFEEDGGSAAASTSFRCHEASEALVSFLADNGLCATLFVTGEILERQPRLLEPYLAHPQRFQFETHGYDHASASRGPEDRWENIVRGVDAYEAFFGRTPAIYRAPDGIISAYEARRLPSLGLQASSSLFPSWFPGRFNNLHVPREAFRIRETGLAELPFATTSLFRAPIALSYIQLLGKTAYRLLLSRRIPGDLVFDFHLHDLAPRAWDKRGVRLAHRLLYARSGMAGDPFAALRWIVRLLQDRGYAARLLAEHGSLRRNDLPAYAATGIYG